ncbi:MAG TPA: alpha/beta hydrolase-fold protein [Pirellulales bacterium]|nr:alpha/beta hydrolase-fold protein [Pirellulales bacterium]
MRGAEASPATLLAMPEVRKELATTDEQGKGIDEALAALEEQSRALFGNFRELQNLPEEERAKRFTEAGEKMQEARDKAVEKIATILDKSQLARLEQLRLQREGITALSRTEVADRLGLSAEQRDKLHAIQEGVRGAGAGARNFQDMSDDERRELFSQMQERRRKADADMLLVLTADQKDKLTELKGAEFKFPAPRDGLTITPSLPASGGDAPAGFDIERKDIARGHVETVEYDSTSVGGKRKMVVYTPPGYAPDRKYPVLYLLHGAGDNETGWQRRGVANVILDNLYAEGKLAPMIVVMPNGSLRSPGNDRGRGRDNAFENDLLHDILPYVESNYAAQPDAGHRAIAGLSMGGGQAISIGLAHLDTFAWVGGFSSALFGPQAELIGDGTNRKQLRLLWLSCGNADRLIDGSKALHDALEQEQVPHIWHVDAGSHAWPVWRNDLYLLAQKLFRDDAPAERPASR